MRKGPPERILLVRNDRIGDLMLTLPAMMAVRRHWPRARVTALVSAYAGPLLDGCRYVDEVMFDKPEESAGELARRLKPMKFDAAVVFNTNTRNCLAMWRAGIGERVCWAYKPAGWLLGNRRVRLHRSHPPVHEAEFALAFVRALGVRAELSELEPRLDINPALAQQVARRIGQQLGQRGPLFGVHPGNLKSAYNWPIENYAQLVNGLAKHGRVMVTGSPAEEPLMNTIRQHLAVELQPRVGFFTDFSLAELAAAVAMQDVLTISSTGPMHIAGIVGTPVVALFSPHPAHVPAKWAPLGAGHTILVAPLEPGEDPRVSAERGTELMARISVEEVLEANLQTVSRGKQREQRGTSTDRRQEPFAA